ncbi:MAG: GAF domain-containing protein, partial [Pseudolabrys sp.]
MQRRGGSGQPVKGQSANRPKACNAPTAQVSAADLQKRVDTLTRELSEAREQQTATADVLKVISSSPGELEPVFNAMLENATRICEAKFGTLYRYDGGAFHPVTFHKVPSSFADFLRRRGSFVPPSGTPLDRLLRTKEVIRTPDDSAAEIPSPSARLAGAKSHIAVPMFKDDQLAGAIVIYRQEVRPFTDRQIDLVKNFAAQAVIAIENTRLLNETKEALEQQRASAEVLNVISNSVSDAEPVFEKIVESCERIFATSRIGLNLIGPDGLVHAGAYGKFPGAEKLRRENFPHPVPGSATEAAISAGRPIQYPDALSDSDVPQYGRRAAKIVGFRAFVMAPLLSEGRGLGAIFVGRETIGSFSDKEIALLKTFASQAVIAIENTRLLNELRQRTDDLTESLEQQTATSEVLRIISSSPGDLEPVFEAMLQNSVRICEAGFGQMFLYEGDNVRLVAAVGVPTALVEFGKQRGAFQPSPGGGLDGVMRTKQVVHIADLLSEHASYPPTRLGGARSYIAVPMLKENKLVGAIAIYR